MQTEGTASDRKARAIVAAARVLFLKHGFEAVTVDEVAKEAGVSKATVYAHFASKENLFAMMVFRVSEEGADLALPALSPATDIKGALKDACGCIAEMSLRPEMQAIHRIMVSEAPRFPAIPQALFSNGPMPLMKRLADFLEEAVRLGLLAIEKPMAASCQLLWLVKGPLSFHGLMAGNVPAGFPTVEEIVAEAAGTFWRANRPPRVS